ncbi:MAG: hypothetical protein JSV12_07965 [Candidatus Bathyarchaeota archaeon]|nr:MAG: hypothetical protein JSV12_07965 [Candidatus Bathyarchaeota archaeon]
MKSNCVRCGQKIEETRFIFYEVDQRDKKYEFGIFCVHCTTELLDELKGKVEWFHIERTWKGYIHPEARLELEKTGFIHSKRNPQYVEINPVGRKREEVRTREALDILRVKYAGGLISKQEYRKLLKKLSEVDT